MPIKYSLTGDILARHQKNKEIFFVSFGRNCSSISRPWGIVHLILSICVNHCIHAGPWAMFYLYHLGFGRIVYSSLISNFLIMDTSILNLCKL